MFTPGCRDHDTKDKSAVVMIGDYRFKRLSKPQGLDDKIPELFELSGPDGTVHAVTEDVDLLIAFAHFLHPRDIGAPRWAMVPCYALPYSIVQIRTLDLEKRALFEYYEVWDEDGLWARFPSEDMANLALEKIGAQVRAL
jgi:hypothetical protein